MELTELLMSGNEAFTRGIFESGVRFAANYPGTPLSEVGDYLKFLSETSDDFTFDYSLNEKVALESCIGASWSGVRTVAMFKHLGLNVAADPLHTFPYSGTNGGMLILCGGDPGILSSTNAQDNRLYSLHTKIPIIEPGTVQECKDLIKEGLQISEKYNVPIYLHVTTRLCHSHGVVTYGKVDEPKKVGYFKRDTNRYINTLWKAIANQKEYFAKIGQVAKDRHLCDILNQTRAWPASEKSDEQVGILTSGICYSYVLQACHKLEITPPILKLGLIFPINKEEICSFVKRYDLKKLLVVEELEPFIETHAKQVFYQNCESFQDIEIHGKDFLPRFGELNTEILMQFFIEHFQVKNKLVLEEINKKEDIVNEIVPTLPRREPTFCSGCPYRPVFYKLKKVINNINSETGIEFIYGGDIGCYTLAEAYPYQMLDWVTCMGAGIGIANGMAQVVDQDKQKLIAFIGDSTLFHSGIQSLINAIKNDIDITIIIFNNDWTAMTGHQETLITPREVIKRHGSKSKIDSKSFDLIKILESFGVETLVVTEAYNLEKLGRIFSSTLTKKGTKVIVIKEECTLEKKRRLRREIQQEENTDVYYTISESCVKCNECIETLGCPAINATFIDVKDKNDQEKKELLYYIDEARCVPTICPGVCKAVCPNNFIYKTIINPQLEEEKK